MEGEMIENLPGYSQAFRAIRYTVCLLEAMILSIHLK